MKKLLAILMGLMLAVSVFAGCTTQQPADEPDEPTAAPGADTPDEPEAPLTNADREKVTIRFTQFGNNLDDQEGFENDPIRQAIEEAVNIELVYDTGTDGFVDRMQTELFAGNAAELTGTFGEADKLMQYIEEDLIWNLSEIVNAEPERYPTLYKIMNSDEYKMYNELYSGDPEAAYAIYGIAALSSPSFAGVPVYNQAILDEVNEGKVPQTVEEFIAFTSAAAEAGYVGWWPRNDKLTNWNEIDKTIAAPQGTTILAPKGELWNGFTVSGTLGTDEVWTLATTSDEAKEVVKQLAEMYAAGGIDNGIGVKGDFDDAYADFAMGKLGAVNFGFGYPDQFKDFFKSNAWKGVHADAELSDLALGVALTSDGNYGTTYMVSASMGAHHFIPTSCEYPDRVLDLVEFLASQEGQDLLHNTTNYEFREDQGADYWEAATAPYGYGDGRCKYVWFSMLFSASEYEVDFTNNDWWTAVTNPINNSDHWATEEDQELLTYARGVISGYVDEAVEELPAYYGLVTLPEEANELRNRLADITNQYLTQMMGGQLDVEEAWPDYVAEYEAAGAAELETMLNEAVAAARDGVA
ncbi:MAG TPA: extracellular solute-binding protein [Candidatus Aphodomorpha intestinavium]|uniref:Extracellular solute-binding protein n=1 Tax=Candidatus Aphodomorpha intestinavium TaxID=2840672 RepID=A0A9D1STA8_9FIRM|nr:extracellular solute-binding protein [Candidatus Aphodomorpha intestinavium]